MLPLSHSGPPLEPRLQRRYHRLVTAHLHAAERLAAGIHALPELSAAFASTQAAWRFFANPRTSPQLLAEPLREAARRECPKGTIALVAHDWSSLNYQSHHRKRDQLEISNGMDRGYFLSTALLVSAQAGHPIAPVELRLQTLDRTFSTAASIPPRRATHIDLLLRTMNAVQRLLPGRTLVHVIDREADSVAHFRSWDRKRHLFIVRARAPRRVRWRGESRLLREIIPLLPFTAIGTVTFRGKQAVQEIAEADVLLDRAAWPKRRPAGCRSRRPVSGRALPLRLIVSSVRGKDGELLARWLLFTNVLPTVPAAQIARWYYFRWRIESYFRLLKSSGHQVEEWQQESGLAIFKRLLVASMACVLSWQVMQAHGKEAARLRTCLVRLSGRQMHRNSGATAPAVLAGLRVFLSCLLLLEDPEALGSLRRALLAIWQRRESG
jgi:hypothetical protein